MKLQEAEILKLLPAWMRDDDSVKGLAEGTDEVTRALAARIKLMSRWNQIDQLDEQTLDEMAWELNIQWYDSTVPIEAKRAVIRNSDLVYSKLGTITTLVDLIPYIESVTNLTETAGGDDGEPYTEAGDNRLRERIRLAPAKRSTAGPELAYIYWAMTADSSIIDVKAVSETETISRTLTVYNGHAFKGGATLLIDTLIVRAHGESAAAVKDVDYAIDYTDDLLTIEVKGSLAAAESIDIEITQTLEGCVKIVPLLKGGKTPDSAMLSKVLEAVNAKDTRPMTDKVRAVAPTTVPYDIEITYYTTPDTEAEVVANVEGSDGAIVRFNEWQTTALGRDINPDKLRSLILSPRWAEGLEGAIRVDVVKPEHTAVADTEVAAFSGRLTVSHKSVTGVV